MWQTSMLNLLMTENAFIYLDQRKFIVVEIIYPSNNSGSVYFYNNFQQIVVRIAANLILTTNDITEFIQWGNEFLFKIAIIYSCNGFRYDL
jgi:hypothetical protein